MQDVGSFVAASFIVRKLAGIWGNKFTSQIGNFLTVQLSHSYFVTCVLLAWKNVLPQVEHYKT